MTGASAGAGRWLPGEGAVALWVPDPGQRLAGVRLVPDAPVAGGLDFHRCGEGWRLALPRPQVTRLEYLVRLRYHDGGTQTVTDPGNPRQAPGAFGPKSVLEFPAYAPPRWLTAPGEPGLCHDHDLPVPWLGQPVRVRAWAPAGTREDEPLPLLVVHDGPEYDELAGLTRYLSAGVAGGWLPRLRAALLSPGPRDDWYSANAGYARALARVVIPGLSARLATTAAIGMGTSLGALAVLHAHCRHPGMFGALFLQSGSFFRPGPDARERGFPHFQRITRFVGRVADGKTAGRPVPAELTCGAIEENWANNRLMARALRARGYPAALHELPDAHNYTAWRDAFDPHLTRLLARGAQVAHRLPRFC